MIINREDFITEMAKRNGVTKKASREYTEMFLNTFFELLTEGPSSRRLVVMRRQEMPASTRRWVEPQDNSSAFPEEPLASVCTVVKRVPRFGHVEFGK